jgi:hypothetical protein
VIKKVSIGFLATVYFIVAVGVTISGHFCGGYLESYSFNIVSEEHDCCGGMPMDNNCCENVQVTIKSADDHFASDVVKIESSFHFISLPVFVQEYFTISSQDVALSIVVPPPPLLSNCPVHIQNRALLI